MHSLRSLLFVVLLSGSILLAQTPAPLKTPAADPNCDEQCRATTELVHKQFGPDFKLVRSFEPLMGDIDGDGTEDLVVVASIPNPLNGEADFGYKVVDPYDAFFGFGNARITQQFAMTNATGDPRDLLIVHNWRSATPGPKWVIINTPFEKIKLAKATVKKKKVTAISVTDETGTVGDIVWTGKKYKWSPAGSE